MKLYYLWIALATAALGIPSSVLAQEETNTLQPDSAIIKIPTAPQVEDRSRDEFATFVAHVDDTVSSQLYAGASVFNLLRGQVPSYNSGAGFVIVGPPSIRNDATVFIDGMPYSAVAGDFFNLNTFDYTGATAVAFANNIFPYGLAGYDGGIFLTSKSGRNLTRPTFDFNSYTTYHIAEKINGGLLPTQDPESEWSLSESVSYAQDFGAFDIRASYNFTKYPLLSVFPTDGYRHAHAASVNLGFERGRVFGRLIGNVRPQSSELSSPGPDIESKQKVWTGNLFLKYVPTEWLSISTQHVIAEPEIETLQTYSTTWGNASSRETRDQKKRMHNLMLRADRRLSEHFSVYAFAGFQKDDFKWASDFRTNSSWSEQEVNVQTEALFGSVGVNVADLAYLDYSFRRETTSLLPEDQKVNSWNLSGSLVVSKLFSLRPDQFYAKLRGTYGSLDSDIAIDFPLVSLDLGGMPEPPSARNVLDFGFDLSFLNDRITASFSRFKRVQTDVYVLSPFGGMISRLGELHNRGYEASVGYQSSRNASARVSSRLTWYTVDSEIVSETSHGGGIGSPPSLGNPDPDWRALSLNTLSYKGFFLNALMDFSTGGQYVSFTHPGGLEIKDVQDQLHVRDLSVGYLFPPGVLKRTNIVRSVGISLSGRNLIEVNEQEIQPDLAATPQDIKSVTLSLSVGF